MPTEDIQIKFSFDKTTLKKIGKGALIAATGGAGIALLQFIGNVDFTNACTSGNQLLCGWIAPAVAWFVPTAINTIKEWMKGEKKTN